MNNKQPKTESVLIIILAETREHEFTFDLFKKNLLDMTNADLCLCVANNHREDINNPFYQHAKFIWRYDEPDDWGDAFDFIQNAKGIKNNWRKLLEIKDQWLGGIKGSEEHPGSAGILLFFRLFLKESIVKHGILEQYDRFIITRSDFFYQVPHVPLKFLPPEYIWIPDGEDYGGYTDRHIIVDRNNLLDVLSISDRVITEPQKLYAEMTSFNKWNMERFIKFSYKNLGLLPKIRRFPYTMYTVRSAGGHTRWTEGYYNKNLGYYIKYQSEYARSRLASFLVKERGEWNHFNIRIFNILSRLLISRYRIYNPLMTIYRKIVHFLRIIGKAFGFRTE
ncbi:MAG: hypothetical protein HN560_02960 [Anaerolineae bacterium]|jgi:hypothetical protein|nr:hypothetical protein [Anaerolineae bacterium]